MANRVSYGKLTDVIEAPDLIEIQTNSYKDFLQLGVPADQAQAGRPAGGLQGSLPDRELRREDRPGLHQVRHHRTQDEPGGVPPRGQSYAAPLYVTFRLKDGDEVREEDVYMGEVPLMTEQGSFVINGAERVVVSQLHRSPGICFEQNIHPNGTVLHSFRIIPDRGSWIEVQFDTSDNLHIYLDRTRRRRKFLASTFLRALGFDTDDDLAQPLLHARGPGPEGQPGGRGSGRRKRAARRGDRRQLQHRAGRKYEPLTKDLVKQMKAAGIDKVRVVNGDPPTDLQRQAAAQARVLRSPRYDLGRVGATRSTRSSAWPTSGIAHPREGRPDRGHQVPGQPAQGRGHGGRHRPPGQPPRAHVGELLANQCRVGLARTERLVKERMTIFDQSIDTMTPQKLINPKALSAVIRDFFGRSQLSQFMDQINPLAELTHKRRLSAPRARRS
jgi:DNA-directed RNA polymerase subunit beta